MKTLIIGFALWVGCVACFAQDSWNVDFVGSCGTPGNVWNVAVAGNYAYIANDDFGLRVIDISNPITPIEVGHYDTPGNAWGVAVASTYVYLADGYYGLRVIDISNPVAPIEVGFYDTPGIAYAVALTGNYAFVADAWEGLRIIDITNPINPSEIGFFNTPRFAYDVAIAENYAYVADDYSLRVIDISDYTAPVEVGFCDVPLFATSVSVSGNIAYVADWIYGFRAIDISNPVAPVEIANYVTPGGGARGILTTTDNAFLADWGGGLRVIDISNPTTPLEVGFYDTPGAACSIEIKGKYAYVADFYSFGIYDCSAAIASACNDTLFFEWDPESSFCKCFNVCIDDDSITHVFVGPFASYCISRFPEPLGNTVIMQSNGDICSSCECSGEAGEVYFADNPFLGNWIESEGLWYRHFEAEVRQTGCVILWLELYLSGISWDCWLPVELLSFEAVPGDREITLNWATASETDNDHFEIERDGAIVKRVVASNSATGTSYNWTDRDLVNGREYSYSLVSVSIEGERETIGTASATPRRDAGSVSEYALYQNYPNPFNPETSITFDLKDAGEVQLTVYNATGQAVRSLVEGELNAGRHTISFDAKSLPSGLYFYRLEAGEFQAVRKMVLMK